MKINPMIKVAFPVLATVCLPFIILGALEANKVRKMIVDYNSATGVVVRNDYVTSPDPQDPTLVTGAYIPSIRFVTEQGDEIIFTDGVGTDPPEYEIGDTVDILYDPQNQQHARINSWKRLWLPPSIWGTVGLLPIIVLLFINWQIERQTRAGIAPRGQD